MDEKLYPIYRVTAEWLENGEYNSTSFDLMLRKELSSRNMAYVGYTFWRKQVKRCPEKLEPMTCTVKYKEDAAWVLTWFSHSTFNTHLSDDELLRSFRQYVSARKPHVMADYEDVAHYYQRVSLSLRTSLMSAENEWRWKLCRCENCQRQGVVRIDH